MHKGKARAQTREEKDWSRVLPSDLSLVWFADRTTGRLARVRLPREKGVGESPSDMASKESADASDRCSVWSPKLGCGLCDGFGLLVCKTEHCIIGQLDLEYLGKITTTTTNQPNKKQREGGRIPNFFKYWYAEGHFCVDYLRKWCPWVFCYGFYCCTSTLQILLLTRPSGQDVLKRRMVMPFLAAQITATA